MATSGARRADALKFAHEPGRRRPRRRRACVAGPSARATGRSSPAAGRSCGSGARRAGPGPSRTPAPSSPAGPSRAATPTAPPRTPGPRTPRPAGSPPGYPARPPAGSTASPPPPTAARSLAATPGRWWTATARSPNRSSGPCDTPRSPTDTHTTRPAPILVHGRHRHVRQQDPSERVPAGRRVEFPRHDPPQLQRPLQVLAPPDVRRLDLDLGRGGPDGGLLLAPAGPRPDHHRLAPPRRQGPGGARRRPPSAEEHTSRLQSRQYSVGRLLPAGK